MSYTPLPDPLELPDLLVLRLICLRYLEFAFCVKRVLEHSGYQRVRLSNRKHLRGRTEEGGFDMIVYQETGLGVVPVLVQVKRYTRPVSRRAVDEVRGAQLRHGISYAVLVTTATISRAARNAAAAYPGRPVRLIDGGELGTMMLAARIGVKEDHDIASGKTTLSFTEEPFELLMAYCNELRKTPSLKSARLRKGAR
jgi:restriction endonuclease Mrr